MRPRPGRAYSAEYGSWLILIWLTADALTRSALTSMPLTTIVRPPLPSAPASRQRDAHRGRRTRSDGELRRRRLESLEADAYAVAARRHRLEPEIAGRVGGR